MERRAPHCFQDKTLFEEGTRPVNRLTTTLVLALIALALFTVVRLVIYLSYPEFFSGLDAGDTLLGFLNGIRFDASVVARYLFLPAILMLLPLKFAERRGWFESGAWLMYLLTIGMLLVLAGDAIYFGHVRRHLSYELAAMQNDWQFLLVMARSQVAALLAFAATAGLLFVVWRKVVGSERRPLRYRTLTFIGVFFALLIVGRGGPTGKIIEIIDAFGTGTPAYGHLSLNGVFTATAFALNNQEVDHRFHSDDEALATLNRLRAVSDPEYPMTQSYPAEPNGRNLVFVLLESWNFDFVDSFGGRGIGATPNFDALARDGLRFSRFYAAGQRSIEGIQATLTGIPILKGMPRIDTGVGISSFTRIGQVAQGHGYETVFVQSSPRDSFKVEGIAAATGFAEYYGMEDVPLLYDYPDPDATPFGWDYDTLMFLKQRLDRSQGPFLAYLFTGSTHVPFPDLEEFRIREPHGAKNENGYINSLHYADWALGEFMDAARQEPWFDNTIFVFTADHASHFQKGGVDKYFHIPLLIYAPGHIEPGESTVVGSQLDTLPTIFDLLGFEDRFASVGESLFRKQDGGYAFVSQSGQAIGLIDRSGYVLHNLERRLEAQSWPGIQPDTGLLQRRESELLALDQLAFQLLRENRWAP